MKKSNTYFHFDARYYNKRRKWKSSAYIIVQATTEGAARRKIRQQVMVECPDAVNIRLSPTPKDQIP